MPQQVKHLIEANLCPLKGWRPTEMKIITGIKEWENSDEDEEERLIQLIEQAKKLQKRKHTSHATD